ncbi:lipocalin-like domain-containing protein [Roseofilum sp. BLCC_M154]|uniref:Lipocalin-like domain-containing protein n=1 Tax=Roseofilum acuticapitatum BLCC-M154 TaxID=3022444 RepID=A0ABT7AZK4_9CYAN|nr:lipocalin-like domain-containing protein [Roseofilum acuticapitatum]MDJ1172315.1 lipocalin-like domain-containing protein [Roseofilum acuticapitatum BLCC-M154]
MTQETKTINSIITQESLVGIWKLMDMKTVDDEQNVIYSYGKNPPGYLIYTKEGYVSVAMMNKHRLNLGLTVQHIMDMGYGIKRKINIFKYIKALFRYIQAVQQFVSYTGQYKVRDNKVIHNLEICSVPDVIGVDFERAIEISGDQLFMTVLEPDYTVYTTWQRVSGV